MKRHSDEILRFLTNQGIIEETRPGYFRLTKKGEEFGQAFFTQLPVRIDITYGEIGEADMRCSCCKKPFVKGDNAARFKAYYPGAGNSIESPTTCLSCMAEIVRFKRHPCGFLTEREL